MMLSAFAALASCEWKLAQTLKPEPDTKGIFGRAVSISQTTPVRLAVSASWDGYMDFESGTVDEKTGKSKGSVYIYEFNADKGEYVFFQKFTPTSTDEVEIRNFGSTLQISSDGKRIVAGAPYSFVKNNDGVMVKEAGAVVVLVFNESSKKYEQKTILHVTNPKVKSLTSTDYDEEQGLGRSLTATSDCKIVASAYYNKPNMAAFKKDHGVVFVTSEDQNGKFGEFNKIPPSVAFPTKNMTDKYFKYGADLQFTDASHLLVASYIWTDEDGVANTNFGTAALVQKNGGWELESEIPVPKIGEQQWSQYGNPISMPNNDQTLFGTAGAFVESGPTKPGGAFFIQEKKVNGWSLSQQIDFPIGKKYETIEFCDNSVFFTKLPSTKDENGNDIPHIGIFRRNSTGSFTLTDDIASPPLAASDAVNFGSDMRWGDDCKAIYIGAMAKRLTGPKNKTHTPELGSRTYIFRFTPPDNAVKQDNTVAIAVGTTVGVIVVIALIVGIVFYVRKNSSKSKSDGANKI